MASGNQPSCRNAGSNLWFESPTPRFDTCQRRQRAGARRVHALLGEPGSAVLRAPVASCVRDSIPRPPVQAPLHWCRETGSGAVQRAEGAEGAG